MEKEQQKALQWFVEFANMNLAELTPGDKAKLGVESEEYLFPKREFEEVQKIFGSTGEGTEDYNRLLNHIKRLEKGMGWAFDTPPRDSPEYWSLIRELQSAVKETLGEVAVYHPQKIGIWPQGASIENLAFWGWDAEGKFRYFEIPLTGSHNDYIIIKLYRLSNNIIGRSTLRICPAPKRDKQCGKFFLNFSRREKRFCSSRCMWRFNTAERRKANPEANREYQKAVMEDKYRVEHDLKPKRFYKNKKRKESGKRKEG
jgi:hypothetical protein